MELLRKNREIVRLMFDDSVQSMETMLGNRTETAEILPTWALIKDLFDKMKLVDEEIYDLMLVEEEKEVIIRDMRITNTYRVKYASLELRFQSLTQRPQEFNGGSGDSSVERVKGRSNMKLPIIEFKKFDGDVKKWLPFWTQFRKIHEDKGIDDEDKVEYLILATVPESKARQLIESYPATGTNYTSMIDALRTRYGREDVQVEVYIRELLKLVISNAISAKKMNVSLLYDSLESQLRSLELLGITRDKFAAVLFPLIESSVPEELLKIWHRSVSQSQNGSCSSTLEDRLKNLMTFLKNEVENDQRLLLSSEGFGVRNPADRRGSEQYMTRFGEQQMTRFGKEGSRVPSAAGLLNHSSECTFCDKNHPSRNCFQAMKLTLQKKKNILRAKNACFKCLKFGHPFYKCREKVQCATCKKTWHYSIMCPQEENSSENAPAEKLSETGKPKTVDEKTSESLSCMNNGLSHVFLQTLRVQLNGPNGPREVRCLIDTGCQNTYILNSTASTLGYISKRQENMTHSLFGGIKRKQTHECFDVEASYQHYSCTFEALSQDVICTGICPFFDGEWSKELRSLNIELTDIRDSSPIELLLGADIVGKLHTGKKRTLSCGLVAIETRLGWTVMGKVPLHSATSAAMTVSSCLHTDESITGLWDLDVLGISDPVEKKTRAELEAATKELFLETIAVDDTGRYEVRLPWIDGHPELSDNYFLAKMRLKNTLKKVADAEVVIEYGQVFDEWMKEGIIEEVIEESQPQGVHYLPHRPVIRESSATTKIRPVFDASAKSKGKPSLNECLEKGMNLIELIPSLLLKFRHGAIGVIADIKKAFLQIGVHEKDRDFLRFLWIDPNNEEKTFRHKRVVFGVTSSPFLLGATIEYHLESLLKKGGTDAESINYSSDTLNKLNGSFYVDNLIASVASEEELQVFMKEAVEVMNEAKFELRVWEYTGQAQDNQGYSNLLGLVWNKTTDFISINPNCLKDAHLYTEVITKRSMLSVAQRIFDPIGFTCPATLLPKILMQKTWKSKLGWDAAVDPEIAKEFTSWMNEVKYLCSIDIPRWIRSDVKSSDGYSIHTFCDASQLAYSAVVFLRGTHNGQVRIDLLAAKSRIAPMKDISIPRMELLAALIGARLANFIRQEMKINADYFYWSDSSTVISWVNRSEPWSPFVFNRVTEIRTLTLGEHWRYIPSSMNPADLPSRGCFPKKLSLSKWWEGPSWLLGSQDSWPSHPTMECDEDAINKEKKKKLVTCLFNSESTMTTQEWHMDYFSSYTKQIRMLAWIRRFRHNVKGAGDRISGEISCQEFLSAETFAMKIIHRESFDGVSDQRLQMLKCFEDEDGLIRLQSKICRRNDDANFCYPIILPSKNYIVEKLIYETHLKLCHAGVQGLMSCLREKYWILGGRRTIKSAINKCATCKRFNSKSFEVEEPPLPVERVRDAVPFEVSAVDFAGPLYLRGGEKAWICLFTCAVYRAVHLELCTALTVDNFMQALRRFVARRGRPRVIYSDNATNFVGLDNAFNKLDWQSITATSAIERINWKFNPPTASWWGGFWERLIRLLKQMLKKVLGRASLRYEDLQTILCDCERVINSRPLTYMSSDTEELQPLTPMMFLNESCNNGLPDCDEIDEKAFCRKILYLKKLRHDLKKRFRNEYLGLLKNNIKRKYPREIQMNEIVLIGSDDRTRLEWPLGRVVERIVGKDNKVRVVKVLTSRGTYVRPVQRIFPLECSTNKTISTEMEKPETAYTEGDVDGNADVKETELPTQPTTTRCGRQVKLPRRFL